MTTLYLIRHAEAEGNAYRRIDGWYNSLITPNGLLQIEALRRRFEPIQIDACYASNLYRTCNRIPYCQRRITCINFHLADKFSIENRKIPDTVQLGIAYRLPDRHPIQHHNGMVARRSP